MSYGQQSKLEGTYSSRLELQKKNAGKNTKRSLSKKLFFNFHFRLCFLAAFVKIVCCSEMIKIEMIYLSLQYVLKIYPYHVAFFFGQFH